MSPQQTDFFRHVEFIPESGCWIWMRSVNSDGYGQVWVGAKSWGAHRLSYALFNGPIPAGASILHRCDVRCCVNPAHLFVGSQQENIADMIEKRRHRVPRGRDHARAKLTEDQVRAIRADPRKLKEIAADYGVHFSLIGKVRQRSMWGHVV